MRTVLSTMLAAMATVATAQEISGSWKGELAVNASTRLAIVINISHDDSGKAVCTLDSPDQGATGIAASVEHLDRDSIAVSIGKLGAAYSGKLRGGIIRGTFRQMGMPFRLDLEPGKVVMNRPQTPRPPYPYATEDVSFVNTKDGATLSGTLTLPVGHNPQSPVPVVIMVSGSGLQNRDEELFGHKPFLVLADHLARNGIASLRYDDRGAGRSTGDAAQATTADFMEDANAGVGYLRKQGKRFSCVGAAGHSEGALIAFMLAARDKVDFIVSLAGPGVKGDTIIAEQTNAAMRNNGMAPVATARSVNKNAKEKGNMWLRHFVDYDPAADISATKCPVMAVNGGKDMQVTPGLNLTAIRRMLRKNPSNIIREYGGLNHLFQHCTTGYPDEYGRIEETMSKEVMDDITGWIRTVCR